MEKLDVVKMKLLWPALDVWFGMSSTAGPLSPQAQRRLSSKVRWRCQKEKRNVCCNSYMPGKPM